MEILGVGSNYSYAGTVTNHMQEKQSAKEAVSKMAGQSVQVSLSDEGK